MTTANLPPVADVVGGPFSGSAPLVVQLDASKSFDPDGQIVSYAWTFGDGSTDSDPTVEHVYANTGTYDARLVVTDDYGATRDGCRNDRRNRQPPPRCHRR